MGFGRFGNKIPETPGVASASRFSGQVKEQAEASAPVDVFFPE